MRGALRLARQRWWLGALVTSALIGIFAEIKAQPAATPPIGAAALVPSGDDALALAADAALSTAMRAGDRSAARRLLSLEFSFTDQAGALHGRKDVLANLKGVAAATPSGVTEKVYGGIAMITGHRMSARGNMVFFLDIWAKQKRAWRALVMQEAVLAAEPPSQRRAAAPEAVRSLGPTSDCQNPCQGVPYRVRSQDEQDVITAFQAIAKAIMAHDADDYARRVSNDYVHYETDHAPAGKPERTALVRDEGTHNNPALLSPIQSMRLWVYGDGAAMISAEGVAGDAEPRSRVARVWVHHNGQWQMAISVQTDVEPQRASSQ
jgi:hypothetical protein